MIARPLVRLFLQQQTNTHHHHHPAARNPPPPPPPPRFPAQPCDVLSVALTLSYRGRARYTPLPPEHEPTGKPVYSVRLAVFCHRLKSTINSAPFDRFFWFWFFIIPSIFFLCLPPYRRKSASGPLEQALRLPPHYGTCLHFYRGKIPAVSSVIASPQNCVYSPSNLKGARLLRDMAKKKFSYTSTFQLLDKSWSQMSSLLPPGSSLHFLSRVGFSNPTACRFFIECC